MLATFTAGAGYNTATAKAAILAEAFRIGAILADSAIYTKVSIGAVQALLAAGYTNYRAARASVTAGAYNFGAIAAKHTLGAEIFFPYALFTESAIHTNITVGAFAAVTITLLANYRTE